MITILVDMSIRNTSLLSLEIESETVFIDMNDIDEICESSYVKSFSTLKENIKGLTLINNNILPVISYSGNIKTPVKGVVVKNIKPIFFLAVESIGTIFQKDVDELEKTDEKFIYKSGEIKLINIKEIERYLA